MRSKSLFSLFIFVIIFGAGIIAAYSQYGVSNNTESSITVAVAFVVALIISSAIKIAEPWDKAVVLRLGRFHSLQGPEFFIISILDNIPHWIDTRVITTSFKAEKTLTKDTVPQWMWMLYYFGKY